MSSKARHEKQGNIAPPGSAQLAARPAALIWPRAAMRAPQAPLAPGWPGRLQSMDSSKSGKGQIQFLAARLHTTNTSPANSCHLCHNMHLMQPSQYDIVVKQLLPDASDLAGRVDTDVGEAEEDITLFHEALQSQDAHLSDHDVGIAYISSL